MTLAAAVSAGAPLVVVRAQTTNSTPTDAGTTDAAATERAAEPAPLVPLPEAIAAGVRQLGQTLSDPVATQPQRDEAARRLILQNTPEASAGLRSVLTDPSNPRGQLAVATALADVASPEASFVGPLSALLGDPTLTGAAARALSVFKEDANALNALTTFARSMPTGPDARQREPARVAAIGAMGGLVDKRTAATLVELLRSDLESDAIRAAAADALAALSGRREFGHDEQQWTRWWDADAGKRNEADFRALILNARAGRADVLGRREQDLAARLRASLNEQYLALPRDGKQAALSRYLADGNPVVRAFGAATVVDEARNANPPTPATREQLRAMVGDSDAGVRLEVATTLRAVNDPAALESLRLQLAQERNADVRLALIGALGTIGDARAVSSVLPLVDDPSDATAIAAVRALAQLAPALKQSNPALAGQVRQKLVEVLRGRAAKAGNEALRAAVVRGIAPLADPSLTPMFLQLLNPRESVVVRVAALRALATVGDPKAADRIVDLFDPQSTPEPEVRLSAVRAMGAVGSFEYAEKLLQRMDKAQEPVEDIRLAAAESLNGILPSGNKRGLTDLAGRFKQDPPRRLGVLKVLVDKLERERDPDLAVEQQNLAEVQEQVGQFRDAAASFKRALDYWTAQGQPNAVVVSLIEQYIRTLLKSGQYLEASQFATTLIAQDAANVPTVWQQVRNETDALRQRGDLTGALRLVGTFKPLRMGRYNSQLADLETEIRRDLEAKTITRPAGNARCPRGGEWPADGGSLA